MTKITVVAAAALLLAGIGVASAQGTSSPSSDSGSKCWDAATNMARDKMPTTGAPTTGASATGASGAKAAGTGATGSAPTTGMAPAPSVPATGTTATRPAGMQNC